MGSRGIVFGECGVSHDLRADFGQADGVRGLAAGGRVAVVATIGAEALGGVLRCLLADRTIPLQAHLHGVVSHV